MPRPKGSRDKRKRKRKVLLDGNQERKLIEDYENGYTSSQIQEKYGITKSTLSALRKERGIKPRLANSDIVQWRRVDDFNDIKNTSGIYAIYFVWNYNKEDPDRDYKINDIKAYIGSSVAIGARLMSHVNKLDGNKHINKGLQDRYNDSEFSVKYAIIEECSEDEVLQKEGDYLHMWNMSCFFNMWRPKNKKEIEPWLKKAITLDHYAKDYTISKKNFYNGTACKETKCVHKSGYGRMKATIDGVTEYFTKHSVAYWHEYGEYVDLVRHLCNNPKCYNPKHLAEGSHRQNGLDRRGDFPEEFERKWLECRGDLSDISQYFASKRRWKLTDDWFGMKVSYSVYHWEKKLRLKEKYPDVMKERLSRLRKAQAAKEHETRKRNAAAKPMV